MTSLARPVLSFLFLLLAATAGVQAGSQTLHYPTQDESLFSIRAPADWKVSEIEEVGDFGTLESENGSILQFRALELENEGAAMKEIEDITDSTVEFLKKNYNDIELDDPKDITIEGRPGSQLAGAGKDKDGNDVKFLSAIIALGPKSVAEVWAAVFGDEKADLAAAQDVLNSFKPAGGSGGE